MARNPLLFEVRMAARLSLTGFLLALVLALATCLAPVPTSTPVPTASPVPIPTATPVPGERQEAVVVRVVDGDTIVVDLEGKQYELTGTAQEQYDRWRELLHRIYVEETGFDQEASAGSDRESP